MNLSVLIVLAVLIGSAQIARRRGARLIAAGCVCAAVLPALSLWQTSNPFALAALLLVVAGVGWQRYGRTAATVTRWGASLRRKSGVASGLDIYRNQGGMAMRRRAATLRPSLKVEGHRARLRQLTGLPVTEVAVKLCRVGKSVVWAAVEEVVLVFGGPRKGKTQWLAGQVIDAPGAVIVTSTRTDLLDQVGPLRSATGPVYVFNPVGLGGRESTVTFDPLTGCADPVAAAERATDMLAATGHGYHGGGSGDREFWDDQGRRNLAALLHAAALDGDLTMADVGKWLSHLVASQAQITGLLRNQSPEPAFVASITQFIETNEKTRSSITATIAPALSWLTHKPAQLAALPVRDGGHPLDIDALLAERGSVFMLGGEEHQVAPLVCAMTGWIAREARRLAAFQPDGRLDPPLSLRLDEAALICRVPLHHWTADMGGRGVSIVACFQSRAQLIDHYGDAKAATIINNAGPKVLFGGTGDRDDLNYWSTLAGERDEPIITTDLHGRVASRTTRRVPVLAPAQIATLPKERVVVFTSTMAPVIGRAEQAWRRYDVRAHHTPKALAVRARARLALIRGGTASRGRIARAWMGRHLSPVGVWFRARGRVVAAWWARARAGVTGAGAATTYVPFGVVDAEPITEPLPIVRVVPALPGEHDRPSGAGPAGTPGPARPSS